MTVSKQIVSLIAQNRLDDFEVCEIFAEILGGSVDVDNEGQLLIYTGVYKKGSDEENDGD